MGKNGPDQENSRKYLPFGKKIVKIGPVDTEITLLIVKKEEINASKIYSPVGNLAERAKLVYILRQTLFRDLLNSDNDLKLTVLVGRLFHNLIIRSLKKCFHALIPQWLTKILYGSPRVVVL